MKRHYDKQGRETGFSDNGKDLFDNHGKYTGFTEGKDIFDTHGKQTGYVENGVIYDMNGREIGTTDK